MTFASQKTQAFTRFYNLAEAALEFQDQLLPDYEAAKLQRSQVGKIEAELTRLRKSLAQPRKHLAALTIEGHPELFTARRQKRLLNLQALEARIAFLVNQRDDLLTKLRDRETAKLHAFTYHRRITAEPDTIGILLSCAHSAVQEALSRSPEVEKQRVLHQTAKSQSEEYSRQKRKSERLLHLLEANLQLCAKEDEPEMLREIELHKRELESLNKKCIRWQKREQDSETRLKKEKQKASGPHLLVIGVLDELSDIAQREREWMIHVEQMNRAEIMREDAEREMDRRRADALRFQCQPPPRHDWSRRSMF